MVRVSVGDVERSLAEVTVPWLREHIQSPRAKGVNVCVKVVIKSGDVDMVLSTPSCAGIPGPRRRPRPKEQELFDLWDKHGLDSDTFAVGELNAFLTAVKKL